MAHTKNLSNRAVEDILINGASEEDSGSNSESSDSECESLSESEAKD
jgi:hypothetical protein